MIMHFFNITRQRQQILILFNQIVHPDFIEAAYCSTFYNFDLNYQTFFSQHF